MEHAFLEFILAIVVIIVAAKLGGFISTRFNQPSVLGELLAGLLLGPTAFDMLHSWTFLFHDSEMLAELITIMAELGVILLMLLAGLELHLPDLLHAGKVSALSGILGVLVPLGLGFGTAVLHLLNQPEERQRLGLAAQQFAQQYDWRVVVPKFLEIYQRLLAG